MRIGINASALVVLDPRIETFRAHAAQAHADGFASWWLAQVGLVDALTVFTALADTAPGLEYGTAVVPTFTRHPSALAGQALTTVAANGDRPFVLGIGLSHKPAVEEQLKVPFERPIRHLIDYLEILDALLSSGKVDHDGEIWSAHLEEARPVQHRPSVMVAALGEQTLRVTGHRADGTVLWMVGPETIRSHIAPTIGAAAESAGRREPRIVCGLPVLVTEGDEREARNFASELFSLYGQLPSYRAMLDREGAEHPGDVCVVGTAERVREQLGEIAAAGATDFAAVEVGRDEEETAATRAVLKEVAAA